MPANSRNLNELTDQELRDMIQRSDPEANKLRSFLRQAISVLTNQVERIESELSDFTQRGAAMMTVGSLFALFPAAEDHPFIAHMLIWVFPFLLVGIFAYMYSTKKPSIRRSVFAIPLEGNDNELIILRSELKSLGDVFSALEKVRNNSLLFHRITIAALLTYFLSFIFQYYYWSFFGVPAICTSLLFTVIAVFAGIIYWMRTGIQHSFGGQASPN